MTNFWNSVTEPQATILAALLTIVAAVVGVALGAWLFGGQVKDLKSALDSSEKLLQGHKEQMEAKLKDIAELFNAQLTAIQEALGQIRGSVDVLESTSTDKGTAAEVNARDKLRDDWAAIRDSLERIAADPDIDGRTRAKYGRIDRRSYGDLVDCLQADQKLGPRAALYKEAVALYHKYRNGRLALEGGDVKRLAQLRAELTGV